MATSPTPPNSRWHWWRKFRYMIQLDEDESDEDYMRMIEYRHIHLPSIYFPFAVIVLVIVGLVYNEISDGKITLNYNSQTSIQSLTYQCGWEKLVVQVVYTNGLQQNQDYYYRKTACTDTIDPSIPNFCSDMEYVGKVWLACGIMGILWAAGAFGVAIKWGKESKILGALLLLCWVNLSIGVGSWNDGERCKDIESWSSVYATFDTHTGVAIALLYVAIAHAVLGFVLWCYFFAVVLIKAKARQQAIGEGQAEPRIAVGREVIQE